MTDQSKRIIYPTSDGGIAVIVPAPECSLSIDDVAAKDVPAGVPYKIIEVTEILSDRTFRAAWEADFSNPDGYGMGHDAWVAAQAATQPEAEA